LVCESTRIFIVMDFLSGIEINFLRYYGLIDWLIEYLIQ